MPELEENHKNTPYIYDRMELSSGLAGIIQRRIPAEVWQWLDEKVFSVRKNKSIQDFNAAFSAMPRRTGKQPVVLTPEEETLIRVLRPGWSVQHWNTDRLCRVWLLMELDAADEGQYVRVIENLFPTAEMNELVALYSALPVLAYPAAWRARCAEGIRSNIGDVLASIMYENPYPSENLDEPAWNQLVLKAIFTEKAIRRIVNLDERANQNLANTLSDYAHERWAAHRTVHPLLWRCVGKFINEQIFPDILRIARSDNPLEREAAALACQQSSYAPARELLEKDELLKVIIKSGVTWDKLAVETEKVS